MAAHVSVEVEEELRLALEPVLVEEALARVLLAEGVIAGELSVAFVGDGRIGALNREYLRHEGPTDVIAFPLHVAGQPLVGDVYVGVQQAERQAGELGVPVEHELLRLAIHGTLHVVGYDHPEDDDRETTEMYRRQEELLAAVLAGVEPPARG